METMRRQRRALMNWLLRFTGRHPFIGPIMWVLALQYFVVQLIVAAAWPKPYDWANNLISDLGAVQTCGEYMGRYVCSPLSPLMNLSFIVFGITIAVGSVLIYTAFKRDRATRIGFFFMAFCGIATALVGLIPLDVSESWHMIVATPALLVGNLAIVILAVALRGVRTWFRIFSYLCGFVSLLAFALFAAGNDLGIGLGNMERVISYPFTLWMMVTGAYMTFVRLRATIRYH